MLRENPFCWVTIPVSDIDRAMGFYGALFDMKLEKMEMGEETMAMLPSDGEANGTTGALLHTPGGLKPGLDGAQPFFGCAGDLSDALSRVEKAGGSVIRGKTPIGPDGFVAHVQDTEGNRIGLHSMV